MYFIGPKNQRLLFDFIKLYFKCMFTDKLNMYDENLIYILDEYNYYVDYKKEWSKERSQFL